MTVANYIPVNASSKPWIPPLHQQLN